MAAVLLTLLCSCSSLYENGLDYNNGWRKGKVLGIETGETARKTARLDCRKRSADAHTLYVQYDFTQRQDKYFATVRTNFPKFALLAMPYGSSVKPGDWIFLNIH